MARRRPFTMSICISEYRGDWDPATRYYAGDIIRHSTGIYLAMKQLLNVEPPATSTEYTIIFPLEPFTPALPAVPTLATPADETLDVTLPPVLSWNAATGATNYHLQLATDEEFTDPLIDDDTLTDLEAEITGLDNSTEYFWRVRSHNSVGYSSWSSVWSFTTESAPSGHFIEDTFDGDLTAYTQYNSTWEIQSGQLVFTAGNGSYTNTIAHNTTPTSDDYSVSVKLAGYSGGSYQGVAARLQSNGISGYHLVRTSASHLELWRNDAGSWSNLYSSDVSVPTSSVLTLACNGDQLTMLVDDDVIDTVTDATYSSGRAGLSQAQVGGNGNAYDDFIVDLL
jgi:hypothetical protein